MAPICTGVIPSFTHLAPHQLAEHRAQLQRPGELTGCFELYNSLSYLRGLSSSAG